MMKLWMIQTADVWHLLREKGTLYKNTQKCTDLPEWSDTYEWLINHLKFRIANYGDHVPWWAWYKPEPFVDTTSLPSSTEKGSGLVKLELNISSERVVLSSFPAWQQVINRFYLPLTTSEDESWNAEIDQSHVDITKWPLPEPWLERVTASWERMFAVETLRDSNEWSDVVQACFEKLNLSDVVSVEEVI